MHTELKEERVRLGDDVAKNIASSYSKENKKKRRFNGAESRSNFLVDLQQ